MAGEIQVIEPNYVRIYKDLIERKFPDKTQLLAEILSKEKLSALEVIDLNGKLFSNNKLAVKLNQKHKSYQKEDILKILKYQSVENLNNTEIAKIYNLSRNTISKWRKEFKY